jgi:hypothetical protein
MTETRDESTGQFTPSSEGLYGREAELVEAGYTPMPDRAKPQEAAAFENARDAAEALNSPEQAEPTPVFYQQPETGEALNADLREGPVEAITVDQAARDLSTYRDANGDSAAKSIGTDFAAEVDKQRADAIKGDPKLAEHYGVEMPPESAAKPDDAKASENADNNKSGDEPAANDPFDSIEGLDPEVRKAVKLPQVRQFLEENTAETARMTQAYDHQIRTGNALFQGMIASVSPEMAQLPQDQWLPYIQHLQQSDPVRANIIIKALETGAQIEQRQQLQTAYQESVRQHQFQTYARTEDAKFRSMVGDRTPAETAEFGAEMIAYAGELGVTRDQLVHELQTNPLMRHSAFQKMIHDAVQHRMSQKASAKAVRAIPKGLPPVQRPGTSQPRGRSDSLEGLEAQLSKTEGDKQIRAAAALVNARRAARG